MDCHDSTPSSTPVEPQSPSTPPSHGADEDEDPVVVHKEIKERFKEALVDLVGSNKHILMKDEDLANVIGTASLAEPDMPATKALQAEWQRRIRNELGEPEPKNAAVVVVQPVFYCPDEYTRTVIASFLVTIGSACTYYGLKLLL